MQIKYLFIVLTGLSCSCTSVKSIYTSSQGGLLEEFEISNLQKVEMAERNIKDMEDSVSAGGYGKIHSILIFRYNKLVYEKYWPVNENLKSSKNGVPGYNYRDSLHDITSITNPVTASLVLLAYGQGKIKSLNERVLSYFPEFKKYDTGYKRLLTINHLLNMTSCIDWNQEIPWKDPRNSEFKMTTSSDAIEFILEQKTLCKPGTEFLYSGACSQLLAGIINRATGLSIDKYAEENLFKPLGIEKYSWSRIKDGSPRAASGIKMRSRDLGKFGLLILNKGYWKNNQILPRTIAAQTLTSQVTTPYSDSAITFVGYSNHFWVFNENINGEIVNYIQSQGNGGQLICLDVKHNLLLLITAGDYNADLRSQRKSTFDIYRDFVFPAIIK